MPISTRGLYGAGHIRYLQPLPHMCTSQIKGHARSGLRTYLHTPLAIRLPSTHHRRFSLRLATVPHPHGYSQIEVDYVSSYNSRSNPAERYFGFVQRLLRTFVAEFPKRIKENQWHGSAFDYLDFVVQAHNSTPFHDSSLSPFMLIFGREFRWPGDIQMLEFPDLLDETIDLGKYYEDRRSFFTEVTAFVRTIIEEVQAQNAVRHDALQHFLVLKPNDQVIIHTPTRQGKLASQWIGPAVAINKHSDLLYRVKFPDTTRQP